MKSVRFSTKGGPDWWVVTHGFSYKEPDFKNVRPIHVLTFAAQHLVKRGRSNVFRVALALENKIFATRYNLSQLRSSIARIDDGFEISD